MIDSLVYDIIIKTRNLLCVLVKHICRHIRYSLNLLTFRSAAIIPIACVQSAEIFANCYASSPIPGLAIIFVIWRFVISALSFDPEELARNSSDISIYEMG